MAIDTGLIVGLSIAAVIVILIIGAAISYALAERRRSHKKPHRTSNISGFIYDEHGQRKKLRGSRSEDWGLLEEARLEPFSDSHTRRTSLYEPGSATSMGPLVRAADQHAGFLEPSQPPTPLFCATPRNASPLLKTLPPLTIPSAPPRSPQPPQQHQQRQQQPHVPSPPETTGSESASIYSQVSATTTLHHRLTQDDSPVPPLPPMPSSLPELPAHLRHYEPIDRSQADSRATIQRGDTVLVGGLLKTRAQRAPESTTSPSLTRNISHIERFGSIRDRDTERRNQLTGAFQRELNGSSVASGSPAPSIMSSEQGEMPTLSRVMRDAAEHVQPLRIQSAKARVSRVN